MTIDKDTILKVMPNAPADRANALAFAISKYSSSMGINTPNALAIFLGNVAHESDELRFMKETGNLTGKAYYPYVGAGPIQVTGQKNYKAVSLKLYGDERLVKNPSLIFSDLNALMYASLYWWYINRKAINKYADAGNGKAVSNYINTGSIKKTAKSLSARLNYITDAISAMKKKIYNVRFKKSTFFTPMPLWNYLSYLAKNK